MSRTRHRRRPEDAIQRAVFQHLRARGAPGVFAFAVPNGGYRTPIEAAILKGTGVVSGVPDIIVLHEGRAYGLEIKTEGGRVSDAQRATHDCMRRAGAEVSIVFGLDQALATLECWQLLIGRSQ